MKKVSLSLLGMLLFAAVLSAQSGPRIKFIESKKDLGSFPADSAVQKVEYYYTNVGDRDLVVEFINHTCSCMSSEFDREPLAPGDTTSFVLTYDAGKTRPGHFKKSSTIYSNGTPEVVRVFVEGVWEAPVEKKERK